MTAAVIKTVAYVDEVANLSDEVAHDIGTVAAAGVATDAARHDHVHILGADCISSSTQVGDDVIDAEHIKALTGAIDFNQQQANKLVLDEVAGDAATPIVGQIWYDTTAEVIKICKTAAT